MHPPDRAPDGRADAPPRRSARLRAAVGGLVVLTLVGFGSAVIASIVTPGGEVVVVDGDGPASPDGARGGADAAGDSDPGAGDGSAGGAAAPSGGGADAARAVVLVHVAGAVANPGVVELDAGSRVVDAIARAGGVDDDADLTAVNLARPVIDGEQIIVPVVGAAPAAPSGGASVPGAPAGGIVSLNSAGVAELQTLPGIGPALASRIIAWRDDNGGFRSVDELLAVSGIGEKTLEGFRELVTL